MGLFLLISQDLALHTFNAKETNNTEDLFVFKS